MPEIKEPIIGRFCWVELQTSDLATARKFYGELFGWTFEEMPDSGGYTMARKNGVHVAGLMTLPDQAAKLGAPPNWGSYIAVEDVQATTDRAAALGATVLVPSTSMGPGTFSVIADPGQGVFMLWHTTQSMGGWLYGEPGSVCWNELVTTDADAAQRFYGQLLGWKSEPWPMPDMVYTLFKQGDDMIGGMMPQAPEMKGAPSVWVTYFTVEDADATFETASRLGAKVMFPLNDVPQVGRIGWLQDPQGAVFAILKPAPIPAS